MPKIYSNKKTINIPFPNKVFDLYLDKFKVKSEGELNDQNIFFIIKDCYKDFKEGSLSLDNFSSIGGYLFDKLKPSSKSSKFGSVLLDIGELNFYVRNTESKPKFSEINNFLSDIEEFFEKYEN
ncbi:MAG: hypothetical protein PHE32_03445 [Candidatus Shapirobacteria bacterium]|nr:hypothetical protein [Candidatus Shapirobacteria bacterium]MDD4410728.1 hypothetical protein [Candidatus Shapirobacteria bacterium]